MSKTKNIERSYQLAKERYAELGVDTEKRLEQLGGIPVSIHCWQGDDVGGFENAGQELGGGLAVTGNYPGKARTAQELREDFEKALSLIPGTPPFQPPCLLRGDERQESGARRPERRPVQGLDRLGQVDPHRHGLQPDLLRASQSGGRLYPHQPGPGHPQVLDRARHPLPRDRRARSARPWARPA